MTEHTLILEESIFEAELRKDLEMIRAGESAYLFSLLEESLILGWTGSESAIAEFCVVHNAIREYIQKSNDVEFALRVLDRLCGSLEGAFERHKNQQSLASNKGQADKT